METPADKLRKAINASRIAEAQFAENFELYQVLWHRACVLKLDHARSLGSAAEKIIIEKYGEYIFDDTLKAKALKLAILEKFGINSEVSVFPEGISLSVLSVQSANTLFSAFRRYGVIMKADSTKEFSMFIPQHNLVLS